MGAAPAALDPYYNTSLQSSENLHSGRGLVASGRALRIHLFLEAFKIQDESIRPLLHGAGNINSAIFCPFALLDLGSNGS